MVVFFLLIAKKEIGMVGCSHHLDKAEKIENSSELPLIKMFFSFLSSLSFTHLIPGYASLSANKKPVTNTNRRFSAVLCFLKAVDPVSVHLSFSV